MLLFSVRFQGRTLYLILPNHQKRRKKFIKRRHLFEFRRPKRLFDDRTFLLERVLKLEEVAGVLEKGAVTVSTRNELHPIFAVETVLRIETVGATEDAAEFALLVVKWKSLFRPAADVTKLFTFVIYECS